MKLHLKSCRVLCRKPKNKEKEKRFNVNVEKLSYRETVEIFVFDARKSSNAFDESSTRLKTF